MRHATRILGGGVFVAWCVLYLSYLPNADNRIGNDFETYLSQLLDGWFWASQNGWFNVPWFTPAFCAGLPKFAHPNGMYLSVPQLLTFIVSPLRAVQLTFVLFAAAGFVGWWQMARRLLRVDTGTALLSATCFLFATFYAEHLLVGHLAFHAVMLVPGIALAVGIAASSRGAVRSVAVVLAAFGFAYQFATGMVHLILPAAGIVAAAGIIAARADRTQLTRYLTCLAVAGLIAVLLSAAQLVAAFSFLAVVPRDLYTLPGFANPGIHVAEVARWLFAAPDVTLAREAIVNRSLPVEQHELAFGVTPVVLLMLVAFAWRPRWPARGDATWLLLLASLALLPFALNHYADGWNQFLKSVPVLRSSSWLLRWHLLTLGIVLLVATMTWSRTARTLPAPLTLLLVAVVPAIHLADDRTHLDAQAYNPSRVEARWLAGAGTPEIREVHPVRDLTQGASQVYCRDDFFGYRMETFVFDGLYEGSPLVVRNGVFNIRNPACLLYPAANHCEPFSHFTADDRAAAESFVRWQPFPFEVPTRQRVANRVSIVTLIVALAVMLVALGRVVHDRWRRTIHG